MAMRQRPIRTPYSVVCRALAVPVTAGRQGAMSGQSRASGERSRAAWIAPAAAF
jgi:hypothetical protein